MPLPLEAKSELTTGKHGDRGRYVTTENGSQIFLTQDGQIGQTGESIDGGDASAPQDQPGKSDEAKPRYDSPFIQSFADAIIANIRKHEQDQQQPKPAAPNPQDHPHHISKLPIPMRQSLLNWMAEIDTLTKPVAWAKQGARGSDPKGVMKAAFDQIDKTELGRVMSGLQKLIAVGDQQGTDLRPFVRHNNLVPRELAPKLKPSDLFNPVQDDERYRADSPSLADRFTAAISEHYAAISQSTLRSLAGKIDKPTEGQIESGNYRKGHIRLHGLDITIENAKGTRRRPEWPTLAAHYGYIKRTLGRDGDHVDVFIGPNVDSELVVVVDQVSQGGRFDEHKCLIGFNTTDEAIACYRKCYTKDWKVGPITTMTIGQFNAWLKRGDQMKRISEQVSHYSAHTQADVVIDRLIAAELGLTAEQYAARRAKNSPGQLGLFGDGMGGDTPLRTAARQQRFDWDESKVKRDAEGKFAEKAEGKKTNEQFLLGKRSGDTKIIAGRLFRKLKEEKYISIAGQKVSSMEELAELAQVYRDPRFETFRAFFVKDGKVVGHNAYTSREPGLVYIPENVPNKISSDLQKIGADGFYILHNHPSGNPAPSPEDIAMTKQFHKTFGDKLLGHTIINHNKGTTISPDGQVGTYELKNEDLNSKENAEVPSDILDETIRGVSDLGKLAMQLRPENDRHVVILASVKGVVQVVFDVSDETMKQKSHKIAGAIKRASRMTGSTQTFLVVPDKKSAEDYKYHVENGVFVDIATPDGKTVRAESDVRIKRRPLKPRVSETVSESGKYSVSIADYISDQLIARELGLTVEQYAARRAKNSPGQLGLFGDGIGGDEPLRTASRQQKLDWDESKIKRDDEGKFATSAGGSASAKAEPTKNEHGAHVITQDDIGGGGDGTFDQLHAGLASEIVQSKIAIGMKGIEGREYAIMQTKGGKWQLASRKAEKKESVDDQKPKQSAVPKTKAEAIGISDAMLGGGKQYVPMTDERKELAEKVHKAKGRKEIESLIGKDATDRYYNWKIGGSTTWTSLVHAMKWDRFDSEAEAKSKKPTARDKPKFNFDQHVKIAADDISKLRKSDVYRLIETVPDTDTAKMVADMIGQKRPDLKDEAMSSLFDYLQDAPTPGKYSASVADMVADRLIAAELGLTVEQYAARKKSQKGQQEFQWITVHPNDGPGRPVMIDKKDGTILAGMGGKFDGQKIGEIGKGKGEASRGKGDAKSSKGDDRLTDDEFSAFKKKSNDAQNEKIQSLIDAAESKGVKHPDSKKILDSAKEYLKAGSPRYRGEDDEQIRGFQQINDLEKRTARTDEIVGRETPWAVEPRTDKPLSEMTLAEKLKWQKENPGKGKIEMPKKPKPKTMVDVSGASYEFIENNKDGTIKVRNDQGDTFNTEQGEEWKMADGSKSSADAPKGQSDKEKIADYLAKNPKASVSEISKATGIKGHRYGDTGSPLDKPLNKILKDMVDSGEIEADSSSMGSMSFSAKAKPAESPNKRIEDAIIANGGHQNNSADAVDAIRNSLYRSGEKTPSHADIRAVMQEMKNKGGEQKPAAPSPGSKEPTSPQDNLKQVNSRMDEIASITNPLFQQEVELNRQLKKIGDDLLKVDWRTDESEIKAMHKQQLSIRKKIDNVAAKLRPLNKEHSELIRKGSELINAIRDQEKAAEPKPKPAAPAPYEPPTIPGQQTSLFGGDDLNTGQKSLFNMARPSKADQRAAKRDTGPPPASLLEQIDDEEAKRMDSRKSLPGQRDMFRAQFEAAMIEQYRAPAAKKSKDEKSKRPKATIGNKGDRGRFVTTEAGDVIFIEGKMQSDGRVDTSQAVARKRREKAKHTDPDRFVPVNDEDHEIVRTVGDKKKDVAYFKQFVDQAHREVGTRYREDAESMREVLAQFGYTGKKASGFLSSLQRRRGDTSNIAGFDEMLDYTQKHHRQLLTARPGESVASGDEESMFFERLKAGFPAPPKRSDPEVIQAARGMSGIDQTGLPSEWDAQETESEPDDEWDDVPFSASFARAFIERYAATNQRIAT